MRRLHLLLTFSIAAACGRAVAPTPSAQATPYLVSAGWLRSHRSEVRLIDMQSSRKLYEQGHLPGALHASIEEFRDAEQNLLPTAALARALGSLGIDADTWVVAYDEREGRNAAYLWFVLQELGHPRISLLDRHMIPFADELEKGAPPHPERVEYLARHHPLGIVDTAWVRAHLDDAVFLDARPLGEYTGAAPRPRMKGGHLPGALDIPWDSFLAEDASYLGVPQARRRLAALAGRELPLDTRLVLYCNNYRQSAQLHFQLARMGYRNLLAYDAGMRAWEARGLPTVAGKDPSIRRLPG